MTKNISGGNFIEDKNLIVSFYEIFQLISEKLTEIKLSVDNLNISSKEHKERYDKEISELKILLEKLEKFLKESPYLKNEELINVIKQVNELKGFHEVEGALDKDKRIRKAKIKRKVWDVTKVILGIVAGLIMWWLKAKLGL